MLFLLFLLAMAAAAALTVWRAHDRLVALDERCNTAFADIDVHLKHRHDVIPNLVETVRGYAGHEQTVLTDVTRARAAAVRASGPETRLEAETQLGQSIVSALALSESYPELKASRHFRELRQELSDCEGRITAARRFHNLAVDEFNATLRQFPGTVVADRARLVRRKPFDLGLDRVLMDEPVAIKF